MLKRLVFILFLAVATVFVSPPAQAAGITTSLQCRTYKDFEIPWMTNYDCKAQASNGLSPYTFQWYQGTSLIKTESTSGTSYYFNGCPKGSGSLTFRVLATDARGAQGTASTTITC